MGRTTLQHHTAHFDLWIKPTLDQEAPDQTTPGQYRPGWVQNASRQEELAYTALETYII